MYEQLRYHDDPTEPIDDKIRFLTNNTMRNVYSTDDFNQDYEELIKYLKKHFKKGSEQEVLKHMEEWRMKFWSPLPTETSSMYQKFLYFLQLPSEYRTYINSDRLYESIVKDKPIAQLVDKTYYDDIDQRLFWKVRATLYDKSIQEDLLFALEDTQKQRVAAMRNRSLQIANLASDLSIEMLAKAYAALRDVDYSDLTVNQIIQMVGTASRIAQDSNAIGEKALLLTEIIKSIKELEELDAELNRFIDAEKIDVVTD